LPRISFLRGVELALSLSGKQIKRECGAILESIRVIINNKLNK
jgi:hypothetical protein